VLDRRRRGLALAADALAQQRVAVVVTDWCPPARALSARQPMVRCTAEVMIAGHGNQWENSVSTLSGKFWIEMRKLLP